MRQAYLGTDEERFMQTLIDGLAAGSIYAAMALALVLVYRATGIVNFAQGQMAMFSTFVAWGLTAGSRRLAILVASCSLFGGMAVERVVIRPFEGG